MKKLILALTALSLAGLFTACQSAKEETVEDRLRDEYGWKGTVLPKAAPDPQSVITESEEPKTEPKDAGIVSTVDLKDTLPENLEEPGAGSSRKIRRKHLRLTGRNLPSNVRQMSNMSSQERRKPISSKKGKPFLPSRRKSIGTDICGEFSSGPIGSC